MNVWFFGLARSFISNLLKRSSNGTSNDHQISNKQLGLLCRAQKLILTPAYAKWSFFTTKTLQTWTIEIKSYSIQNISLCQPLFFHFLALIHFYKVVPNICRIDFCFCETARQFLVHVYSVCDFHSQAFI